MPALTEKRVGPIALMPGKGAGGERRPTCRDVTMIQELEKKSSAVTLSDMELFIFPELIYSLVLANIMSPRIWRWRDDPWFAGLDRMTPYRRITRVKQFIMDHYVFNLDLDTWGLTTKDRELSRFAGFVDESMLAQSNALFGYGGDKHYFDIDIRTHFGLDKYDGDTIPYWKTETVEAMDAFRYRPNYVAGAGECVSLATLYAAALFIVARIPLDQIYLMATPLHSQNFIDVAEGILTNNRRLVTKTMWFNGTPLSAQARRALENERVTIVAHETGVMHAVYPEASISPRAYAHFRERLSAYLKTGLDGGILGNFLRDQNDIQRCFQLRWPIHGSDHYVPIERLLAYEHGSPYRLTDHTRDKLMGDVSPDEFRCQPYAGRIVLNDLETFVVQHRIDIDDDDDVERLKAQFASDCLNAELAIESLIRFCHVRPRLPDASSRAFVSGGDPLGLEADMTREAIIARLERLRDRNSMALHAFYAYRDLGRTEAQPFLLAALTRNPVCIASTAGMELERLVQHLDSFANQSIYDEAGRLAQPDEVWNFSRGDGVEKAILLANLLRARDASLPMRLSISRADAVLKVGRDVYRFTTSKGLSDRSWDLVLPAVVTADA